MTELSVAEQRHQAALAVISDELSISQVAGKAGVPRQTLHYACRHRQLAPGGWPGWSSPNGV